MIRKIKKRFSALSLLLLALALLIGCAAGYFGVGLFTKKDAFTLTGQTEFTIVQGTPFVYTEAGFSLIDFGKDSADAVVVSTTDGFVKNADGTYTLDTSTPGVHGIFYTAPTSHRFAQIRRVRTFTVVAGGEG